MPMGHGAHLKQAGSISAVLGLPSIFVHQVERVSVLEVPTVPSLKG